MDATYNDLSHSNGSSSTPASHYAHHAHQLPPSATAPAPYFADQSSTAAYQHLAAAAAAAAAAAPGGGEDAPAGYGQSTAYSSSNNNMGTQAHGTSSMQNFTSQHPSHAASAADAPQAQGQDLHSAYPYSHDSAYAAQQAPPQSAQGAPYQTEAHLGHNVDVQALLDSLTPAASQMPLQPAQPQHNASSLPSATNLPARPPTQEKPATHPNYDPNDDIRSYHPQNQRAPNTQQRGNGSLQPLNVQNQDFSSMPAQSPTAPGQAQPQQKQQQQPPIDRSETPDDEDQRWPPEVNRRYEEFLDQERKFVTEGQWDQFPMGSRLFIGKPGQCTAQHGHSNAFFFTGNLPTEKVTKRDIFHRFYRHGRLAQISIKQAYGFVQFLDAESCRRALDTEQGQAVRGRKMRMSTG